MKPPLRWIGGKYRVSKQLIQFFPKNFKNYIEPMAGSAAMFFAVKPENAILADINADVINFYSVLAQNSDQFISKLLSLKASKKDYYNWRSVKPKDDFERAVRFAYLNRLCWNGVYRVNQDGDYNVPIGSRLPHTLWKKDHLEACSILLRKAKLFNNDFNQTVELSNEGDFIYFDPPYPKGAKKGLGFNRYSSNPFGIDDHKRLAALIKILSQQGVFILITIADDELLKSIYPSHFQMIKIETSTLISCNGENRGRAYEYILRNYN